MRRSPTRSVPRLGSSVVKGRRRSSAAPASAPRAATTCRRWARPTRPTSASSLSERSSHSSSPSRPRSAKRGAWRVEVTKQMLPRPPSPPRRRRPSDPRRRGRRSRPSASRTSVPTGTSTMQSVAVGAATQVVALAMTAVRQRESGCWLVKRRRSAHLARGDEHDVAAAPTVATVGTASGDVLLAPETHAAVAAAPCRARDLGSISEHGTSPAAGRRRVSASGTTEMSRPACPSLKTTRPVDLGEDRVVDADAGVLDRDGSACHAGVR